MLSQPLFLRMGIVNSSAISSHLFSSISFTSFLPSALCGCCLAFVAVRPSLISLEARHFNATGLIGFNVIASGLWFSHSIIFCCIISPMYSVSSTFCMVEIALLDMPKQPFTSVFSSEIDFKGLSTCISYKTFFCGLLSSANLLSIWLAVSRFFVLLAF